MGEFLSQIWVYIVGALGGVTLGGVIGAIFYGCLKGGFAKVINKIDVRKIAKDATSEAVSQIKKVAFKHEIQPVVIAEMVKIHEEAVAEIKAQYRELQGKYDHVVDMFDKFAAYFGQSFGVTDEAKEALKVAIGNAKDEAVTIESVVVEETTETDKKSIVEPTEAVKTHAKVVR